MDTKGCSKTGEGQIIKFKKTEDSEEVYKAVIFPNYPYVTFTDRNGIKIEGTGYEFSATELQRKTEELMKLTTEFIKRNGRIIIE